MLQPFNVSDRYVFIGYTESNHGVLHTDARLGTSCQVLQNIKGEEDEEAVVIVGVKRPEKSHTKPIPEYYVIHSNSTVRNYVNKTVFLTKTLFIRTNFNKIRTIATID